MLEHGGRLRDAAQRHGIPLDEWLDLSTGISPWSWVADNPIELSPDVWARLPEDADDLTLAARDYYGAEVLPVAGSQAAIQMLPRLRAPGRVGILAPSYEEHEQHWRRAGHEIVALTPKQCALAADTFDVLVLVQPNNPTGHCFKRTELLDWHARLTARGGWLLVDEAFIDATPEQSLALETSRAGLIVLRSLGKFFGLAGARVGFVLAASELRTALAESLGPWTIAGPSRYVATHALRDHRWQAAQRLRLHPSGERLKLLLQAAGLAPNGGCALFQWVVTPHAAAIHEDFAARGILTRCFTEPSALRLGLPHTEADWQRLQAALHVVRRIAA